MGYITSVKLNFNRCNQARTLLSMPWISNPLIMHCGNGHNHVLLAELSNTTTFAATTMSVHAVRIKVGSSRATSRATKG
jgi:hypothetical protein